MTIKTTPITVFTGFLGAGKTTTILSLLPKFPKGYKICLLKNEFGDVEVDSQLAKQSGLAAVSEILNGCMCCVLVGQMKTALLEIKEKFDPDRILIESSGSAFPATLAFQIRDLEREFPGAFKLDSIVTVIDAENFIGYEDASPTAKMQTSYTDVILINKWEAVSERHLDLVIDHLNTLNDLTPKIKCKRKDGVDPDLIIGLDSRLFVDPSATPFADATHNDEVDTATIIRHTETCKSAQVPACHDHDASHNHAHVAQENQTAELPELTEELLHVALSSLSKESIWRLKGFARLSPSEISVVNWAFGRYDLTAFEGAPSVLGDADIKFTVMGERGEVWRLVKKFAHALGATVS